MGGCLGPMIDQELRAIPMTRVHVSRVRALVRKHAPFTWLPMWLPEMTLLVASPM